MDDRYVPGPDRVRADGLKRLGRLTWRATQLGAITTVGFATLFARAAPAQTAAVHPAPTLSPSATQSTTAWPAKHKQHRRHDPLATMPTPTGGTVPQPTRRASSKPAKSSAPSKAAKPAPSPTLAPPTTAPAPPPPQPSPPAPVTSSSSPGHGG
ncbi:MAG TPA: hypothetical protein VKU39_01845 [Streptosporangiaceae bacterium]|nr:hypothetical protein [Streptosporangiaceae bacterium]